MFLVYSDCGDDRRGAEIGAREIRVEDRDERHQSRQSLYTSGFWYAHTLFGFLSPRAPLSEWQRSALLSVARRAPSLVDENRVL
jgi:hypothetical protein